MEYKDYYQALGVSKTASSDDIKKAYKKLAHKYHPDVSEEKDAEARFKDIGEAYNTLKDPEKRAAYDALGSQPAGQGFQPPPGWNPRQQQQKSAYDSMDFADLFSQFGSRGRNRASMQIPGQDYEVTADISLQDVYNGTQLDLNLVVPEYQEDGSVQNRNKTFKVRIPKGVVDKQRLRLRSRGGKGLNGGPDGDLYLNIRFKPHAYYRTDGHDLYFDLAITPWEASLGVIIAVPTLHGAINLKVAPGTSSGKTLRVAKKGLPDQQGGHGDLYAVTQIAVPTQLNEQETQLMQELANVSRFNPRQHLH